MFRTSTPASRCQRRRLAWLCIGLLAVALVGCGETASDKSLPSGDHVWKEQTDTIEKARNVEALIQGGHDQMRRSLEHAER